MRASPTLPAGNIAGILDDPNNGLNAAGANPRVQTAAKGGIIPPSTPIGRERRT